MDALITNDAVVLGLLVSTLANLFAVLEAELCLSFNIADSYPTIKAQDLPSQQAQQVPHGHPAAAQSLQDASTPFAFGTT